MADIDDLQFGAIIPKGERPAPTFQSIISDFAVRNADIDTKESQSGDQTSGLTTIPLLTELHEPLIPAQDADHLAPFESWRMLGNDRYSNCAAVAWANMRRLVTSKLTGRKVYPNMDKVMEIYRTQNPDLRPKEGMASEYLFDYLLQTPGPDGAHIVGYAKVDCTNFEEVKQALVIFGAIWLEIYIYKNNLEEFDYKLPFRNSENEDDYITPHIVLAGGYTAEGGLKIVTWGQTAYLSPEFVQKNIIQAWLVVWPEHFGSRRFTRTIDMERFRDEFKKIKGKTIPPPEPVSNNIVAAFHTPVNPKKTGTRYFNIDKIEPTNKVEFTDENDPKPIYPVFSYASDPVRSVTPIGESAAAAATLVLDNDDLYLIKTQQTLSNRIEIQRILGPHYYEFESTAPTVTAFKIRSVTDSVFCIDNGDLYCIKKPSSVAPIRAHFEVHWAPGEKKFQSVTKFVTALTLPANFRRTTVSGGDLYVFADNEDTGFVRVYCARGNARYSKASVNACDTALRVSDRTRNLYVGMRGDIYMVKDGGLDGGNVEIWFVAAKHGYQKVVKFPTKIALKAVEDSTLWII